MGSYHSQSIVEHSTKRVAEYTFDMIRLYLTFNKGRQMQAATAEQ